MRPAPLIAVLAAAIALAACGREPLDTPDPTAPRFGKLTRNESFPAVGLKVKAPQRIRATLLPPAVFRVELGAGFISCFAYRRKEPLPKGRAELTGARKRLLRQVRQRDKQFEVESSRAFKLAGADAIEIRGAQVIARQPLETRSVHVFKDKTEYVLELLAPPRSYTRANREVFDPMLRSLQVTGAAERTAADRARKDIEKAVKPKQP